MQGEFVRLLRSSLFVVFVVTAAAIAAAPISAQTTEAIRSHGKAFGEISGAAAQTKGGDYRLERSSANLGLLLGARFRRQTQLPILGAMSIDGIGVGSIFADQSGRFTTMTTQVAANHLHPFSVLLEYLLVSKLPVMAFA